MGLLPSEKIKRETFVRVNAKTSKHNGEDISTRDMSVLIQYGIINIDKPKGPTSHQVSDYVQKILGIEKGGHSGTLDPKVTGVLPVALGRGTRIVQALLNAGKEYVTLMHLHKDVSEDEVRSACSSFVGVIRQLPPIKSAVKRQFRHREVYYFEILEIDGRDVLFKIGCEAGTYIRKIVHDLGQKIGCGAHMAELRRTKVGPFNEDTLFTLQEVTDAFWYYKNENNESYLRKIIQPIETAVSHLPKIWIVDSAINSVCHGSDLKVPGVSQYNNFERDQMVAVMSLKDELICLGRAVMDYRELLSKDKGIVVKTEKVFMLKDFYPRIEINQQ